MTTAVLQNEDELVLGEKWRAWRRDAPSEMTGDYVDKTEVKPVVDVCGPAVVYNVPLPFCLRGQTHDSNFRTQVLRAGIYLYIYKGEENSAISSTTANRIVARLYT